MNKLEMFLTWTKVLIQSDAWKIEICLAQQTMHMIHVSNGKIDHRNLSQVMFTSENHHRSPSP